MLSDSEQNIDELIFKAVFIFLNNIYLILRFVKDWAILSFVFVKVLINRIDTPSSYLGPFPVKADV